MSSEKCWIGGKAPKIQRSSCTPRWYCKERFRVLCSIHWTRNISISNDSRKSHGQYIKASRMFRTSSWCSIRLYSGQNGRCNIIVENFKSECPGIWIRLPKHKWPKSWSSMKDPVVPLERNLYGHPLAGLLWERQFEKVLSKYGWEKVPMENAYSLTEKKGYSYQCMWTISNWQARQKTWNRLGKFSWKTLIWENQHHFLTMANYRNMFECRISSGAKKNCRPELQGNLMQKQNLLGPLHGLPSIQRRRKWVSRRIVYSLLTNCSEMSVFGSYWETRYFVVCEQACACGHKMDKILSQTLGAFDLVHSSYKWILAILLCGKHSTTMQTWIVSRLWFCRRPWRFKINLRRCLAHFRKSRLRQ